MTLNELRQEVAALGFENEIEPNAAFISAVRRALSTIYNEKDVRASVKLIQEPLYPIKRIERLEHKAGVSLKIDCEGEAYCMVVSGKGNFTLRMEGFQEDLSFNANRKIFKGFFLTPATLEFKGVLDYTVHDLCFYAGVPGEEDKIPFYGRETEYKMDNLVEDFLGFISLPTDSTGKEISGARIEGVSMFLPYEYSGEICLTYRKAAPEISADELDEEIELPRDIRHLPALLVASYIWLDDDSEKAQYYYGMYREGMAAAKLYGSRQGTSEYIDVLRWA